MEIHVIIHSKHFCLLDFSLIIWQLKIYQAIILPVVLYGCEIQSLTLRDECSLRYLKTEFWDEYLDTRVMRIEVENVLQWKTS